MRTRRGITLIELLLAAILSVIVLAGAAQAVSATVAFQQRVEPARAEVSQRDQFEQSVRRMLERAVLHAVEPETTFFILQTNGGGSGSGTSDLPDSLIFTVAGLPPKGSITDSQDDFETLNEQFGPQGGVAEVSLSTTAFAAPGNETGLFLREQRPSDGDYTQGGYERVLWNQIASIGFEVFDGAEWSTIWDTTQSAEARLPAAVRVSYSLVGQEDQTYRFVVRLPLSDVTVDNPSEDGGQ